VTARETQQSQPSVAIDAKPSPANAQRCCGTCLLGAPEAIKDADFGVKFGEVRTCSLCGWRLYDDWTVQRAGSVERWLPPLANTDFSLSK